jgi:hypothetical protein
METQKKTPVTGEEPSVIIKTPSDIHYETFCKLVTKETEHIRSHHRTTKKGRVHGEVWTTLITIDGLKLVLLLEYCSDFKKSNWLHLRLNHSGGTLSVNEDYCGSVSIDIIERGIYDPTDQKDLRMLWDLISNLRNYKVCPYNRKLIAPEKFDEFQEITAMKIFVIGYTTECSVCFTITRTHTDCGHPLCIKCWQKIRDTEKNQCPCCRKNTLSYMSESPCLTVCDYHYQRCEHDYEDEDEDENEDDGDEDEDEDENEDENEDEHEQRGPQEEDK